MITAPSARMPKFGIYRAVVMASRSSTVIHDSESDSDSSLAKPVFKKSKFSGAFKYKAKFSEEWKRTWPFAPAVPGDPHHFRCNVCDKSLTCGHQGIADVKDHISTQSLKKLAWSLATQPKISFSTNPLKDKVVIITKLRM